VHIFIAFFFFFFLLLLLDLCPPLYLLVSFLGEKGNSVSIIYLRFIRRVEAVDKNSHLGKQFITRSSLHLIS
jgi:hypothetical protein